MIDLIYRAKKYIGENYEKVPYLYSNLFGLENGNPNIHLWLEEIDGNIISICLLYHTCLHFYTHQTKYTGKLLWEVLDNNDIEIVMLSGEQNDVLNKLSSDKWDFVTDYIVKHNKPNLNTDYSSLEVKSSDDIIGVTQLLLSDPLYSNIYDFESLKSQLTERYNVGFGKIFRIKDTNRINGCVAITGENDKFIFNGCLMVDSNHRRKGIAEELMKAVISYSHYIHKDCLCFIGIENTVSLSMHKKFEDPVIIGTITKCIRKR